MMDWLRATTEGAAFLNLGKVCSIEFHETKPRALVILDNGHQWSVTDPDSVARLRGLFPQQEPQPEPTKRGRRKKAG